MADARIQFLQTSQGQAVMNSCVFSNVIFEPSLLQIWADQLRDLWDETLRPFQSTTWSLTGLRFVSMPPSSPFSVEVGFSAGPLVGTASEDVLANQTALLVSTQFLGAAPNRGRVYFAGVPDSSLVAGRWTAVSRSAAGAMVTAWANGIEGQGEDNIFLRIARVAGEPPATTSNPVETVIPRDVPATVRRRRIGVGQ